ncbi:WYL domain-containing protein [Virgibacillus pantothenticus]|uniref:WYL domain-containing protein n=1 Tax=Virgibacillus pantothenticus TaxID=1473 RepID=UPI001BB010A3|nr:WYL domain-containing protein [Virgibacillus pantothenticus]
MDNKIVSFQYINLNSKTRIVHSNMIHVFYKWYSWYAFGYDLMKDDYRMFKIARMKNLEISEKYFVNNYDVAKLLKDYEQKREEDSIYVTIEYLKEVKTLVNEYFEGDVIDVLGTSKIKRVVIKENDFMMFSIILGFGEKIKVLSPLSYQQRMKEHVKI